MEAYSLAYDPTVCSCNARQYINAMSAEAKPFDDLQFVEFDNSNTPPDVTNIHTDGGLVDPARP